MELTQDHYDGGKAGYDAYCKQTGGKSLVTGDPLPPFEALKPSIKDAWAAAYIGISSWQHTKRHEGFGQKG